MLVLKFNSKNQDSLTKLKNNFHDSLRGWSAYINSEVAICDPNEDEEDQGYFYLVMGDNNDNADNVYQVDVDIDGSVVEK